MWEVTEGHPDPLIDSNHSNHILHRTVATNRRSSYFKTHPKWLKRWKEMTSWWVGVNKKVAKSSTPQKNDKHNPLDWEVVLLSFCGRFTALFWQECTICIQTSPSFVRKSHRSWPRPHLGPFCLDLLPKIEDALQTLVQQGYNAQEMCLLSIHLNNNE